MFKSPGNQFLSHMDRKMRKSNYFSIAKKNASIHTDEFIIHTVGAIGKLKKIFFEKNVQVQLMSFYIINLDTIEKCAYVKKNQFEKKVYN